MITVTEQELITLRDEVFTCAAKVILASDLVDKIDTCDKTLLNVIVNSQLHVASINFIINDSVDNFKTQVHMYINMHHYNKIIDDVNDAY